MGSIQSVEDLILMGKEPNYLCLMVGLLTGIVLVTSAAPLTLLASLGVFIGAVSLLLTAYMLVERRRQLLLPAMLGLSGFLPFAWLSTHPETVSPRLANTIYFLNIALWLLFTFYIGLLVFRRIIAARRIGRNEIYGAIYVYLLIGVLFAAVYQLLLVWQPGALYFDPARFREPEAVVGDVHTRGAGAVLYYSFVTLGTVGYGDVTPSSPLARSLSLIEAVIGIMYVATMIARFVSIQITGESRGGEP
ncbi:MAG TPA: ion channel [Candidatus Acidoferrales bacterium]|nr:ion channel [Candidatus Acidoferrales bacterium]